MSKINEEEIQEVRLLSIMEKMPVYYIVDTENVDKSSYVDLSGLRRRDVLEFMYTNNSKGISYDVLNLVSNCQAELKFKQFEVVSAMKNLLDFKMVVEGTSIISKSNKYFVIFVSENKGFDSAVEYINQIYGNRCIRVDKITNLFEEGDKIKEKTKTKTTKKATKTTTSKKKSTEIDPLKI